MSNAETESKPMANDPKSARPKKREGDTFSVDEFFAEIEKAEEIELSKPLPQERLRNKRRLDREAAKEAAPEMDERARQLKSAFDKRRTTKTSNPDTVTGMSKRSPKSKANSVERPSNLPGFEEAPQAGFGHMPASAIQHDSANDPEVLAKLNEAVRTTKSATAKKGVAGSSVAASTPGVTATVAALQDLIEHGRKEVEGAPAWMPHRPERPEKAEGGIPFRLASELTPKGDQPTAIAELVEGVSQGETDQVLLGVTGSGKTYTMAKVIEAKRSARRSSWRPTRRSPPSFTASSSPSSRRMRSSISSPITTTTSRRPTSRARTPISRRNPPSTSRSTACATRRRVRSARTRRRHHRRLACRASTASAAVEDLYGDDVCAFSRSASAIDQRQLLNQIWWRCTTSAPTSISRRGTFRVRGDTIDLFPAHSGQTRAWRVAAVSATRSSRSPSSTR